MTHYLTGLNSPQREAVETTEGALLVLAGAGTGKTRVLTTRLAHILSLGLARGEEVLAVTFTNKAAREMKERIEMLLDRPAEGMWLGTFHSLCARMLRRHAELMGLTRDFVIIDTDDQVRVAKEIIIEKGVDEKRWPAKQMVGLFSRWKDNAWTPGDVPQGEGVGVAGGKAIAMYAAYQSRLQQLNACDFGDLLLHMLTIFKRYPEVLQRYQNQFRYILVDEYQDTNVVQYLWLRLLAMGSRNICVVGDDDQSIYGWRGAQVGNILKFEQDFPGAGVVRLEQNYRSTGHILNVAASLIAHNSERHSKTLWTADAQGEKVQVVSVLDDREEARTIAVEIQKHVQNGGRYGENAILVRTAAQTRSFEERFVQMGLPYQIVGGLRFYERREVRDALAYLRLSLVARDDLAFERIINVPRRGIGDKTIEALKDISRERGGIPLLEAAGIAAAGGTGVTPVTGKAQGQLDVFFQLMQRFANMASSGSPSQLMEKILEDSGYIAMLREDKNQEEARGRLENLKELVRALDEYPDVSSFLEHVSLVMDTDSDNAFADAIRIMTVHTAKGLEFDTVYIPGFEDGLFPHQRALDEEGEKGLEEERRLAYVAITRGRRRVVLMYASSRRLWGNWMPSSASRFLRELPEESIEEVHTATAAQRGWGPSKPSWQPTRPTEPLFAGDASLKAPDLEEQGLGIGVRVFHDKFGYGRIKSFEGNGAERKLIIGFDKAGEKKLLASLAKLNVVG